MINKQIGGALVFSAAFLTLAALLRWADSAGLLNPEDSRRTTQVIIGLALAVYANFMPKQIGRGVSPAVVARAQAALRVAGWSFSLAGLAYAVIWAFAPMAIIQLASVTVVAAAMVVTFAYAVWCYATCRRAGAVG